jgi:3-dehydroquinate synthase
MRKARPKNLIFLKTLPRLVSVRGDARSSRPRATAGLVPENCLLIYDRRLERLSSELSTWIKRFPYRYGVVSGEKLKDVKTFARHVQRLSQIAEPLSPRSMCVVAVGGGSVGDFAGFFASIFKRGIRLVMVPSTWLAAIDSAHGGKTALNVANAKNQLGTFYPADSVILSQAILLQQPQARIDDAMAELGKIALIDGGDWVLRLERTRLEGSDLLWSFLKFAISAKMKIVAQDPHESRGLRQVLNLGHTVGHVFEAAWGWSHGKAVAQGLFYALEFSERRGLLKPSETDRALILLSEKLGLRPELPTRPLSARVFRSLLAKDKKKTSRTEVTYIFLRRFGSVIRHPVTIDELLAEARRQGWVSVGTK